MAVDPWFDGGRPSDIPPTKLDLLVFTIRSQSAAGVFYIENSKRKDATKLNLYWQSRGKSSSWMNAESAR